MRAVALDLFHLNAQYFEDLFVVRSLSFAGYIILLYECIASFPDEVKYIWPTPWSTVKTIYLAIRYGNLVLIGLTNAQLAGIWWIPSRTFCFRVTLGLSFMQFASFASVHVLVLLRAWATWGRRKNMLALLVILFFIYASASIAFLAYGIIEAGYDAYPLSSITRTCIGVLPPFAWLLWVPSLLLECATFALTMASIRQYKVHRCFREQPALVQIICRDAVGYFLVTLFSNIFNILVWAQDANRPLNMLSNSFTLCLMNVAAQRLVLDLRKETDFDGLSTTRVGREVERAIEALPRSRSPSPIVFVEVDSAVYLPRANAALGRSSYLNESHAPVPMTWSWGEVALELAAMEDTVTSDGRTVQV
ncbi:hypothetical protein C8Q73DRAFT_322722 [Cubamyces lactineus]|nr:hypothetical protein C8Q73DRAFT_322722 [Cubamyces lactineus]